MSGNLMHKIRYYKERCRNAFWMLRTGRFKLFLKSLYIEFYPAVEKVRTQLHVEERKIPDSGFVDKRKLLRPSFRPTVSQPFQEACTLADKGAVANELRQILSTITIQENNNS
jgi:hypothetical protein